MILEGIFMSSTDRPVHDWKLPRLVALLKGLFDGEHCGSLKVLLRFLFSYVL